MEFYLPRQTYIQAKLFVEYNKDHEKTISSNSIIAYRTLQSKVAYLQRIFQYTLHERNTRYPKTQEKKFPLLVRKVYVDLLQGQSSQRPNH